MPSSWTFFRILIPGVAAAGLAAGCQSEPDCLRTARLGAELGRLGLPAEADRHDVAAECRGAFEEAWSENLKGYCLPENGFSLGYSDSVYYGVCRDEVFDRNYRLGRTLWVMEVERENLEARLERLEAGDDEPARAGEIRDLKARIRAIDRDLPELEALARMHGLMEPEPVPEPD